MPEVRTERMATGGEAVARLDDGRVVFVRGALPDETVQIEITETKKRFARGFVVSIVEASAHRREPGCEHARAGACGGCDWMHLDPGTQRLFKEQIVGEQLSRLGGVDDPQLTTLDTSRALRSTVRCAVTQGQAGYRRRGSNDGFAANSCGAAEPALEELIVDGFYGDASQVSLRLGVATGERLVITDGEIADVRVPDDVIVASSEDPQDAAVHEVIAGVSFRISAQSFFQTSSIGATALVSEVASALSSSDGPVIDLYGGVGLLGGAAAPDRLTHLVESNPSSVADAAHNLGERVQVVHSRVERWTPVHARTVIADPARRGLGSDAAAVINATAADTLVLVSCDPASLGRDAALLLADGWRYDRGTVIDLFPDTSRIEVVSRLSR